jgi:hypothetical protein
MNRMQLEGGAPSPPGERGSVLVANTTPTARRPARISHLRDAQ